MKREAKMQAGKWYKILFLSALVTCACATCGEANTGAGNVFFVSQSFSGPTDMLLDQLECHSANKEKVLNLLRQAPPTANDTNFCYGLEAGLEENHN